MGGSRRQRRQDGGFEILGDEGMDGNDQTMLVDNGADVMRKNYERPSACKRLCVTFGVMTVLLVGLVVSAVFLAGVD
eukprot:gene3120-21307_t